jgi:hypothetical protein
MPEEAVAKLESEKWKVDAKLEDVPRALAKRRAGKAKLSQSLLK